MGHECPNADQIISVVYDTQGWREMPRTHKMCIQDKLLTGQCFYKVYSNMGFRDDRHGDGENGMFGLKVRVAGDRAERGFAMPFLSQT